MRLFALIAITMVAFAANSVLNRAGIVSFGLDPLGFAGVRLAGGAAMLAVLVGLRGPIPAVSRGNVMGAGLLLLYLVPFSLAYLTLPSGAGALILFGVVQITMFSGSCFMGSVPSVRQWGGMSVAMAGLIWLLWPREVSQFDGLGVAFMALSGFGWGLFSLKGRGSSDPLGDIMLSFVLLTPVAIVLMLIGSGWSIGGVIVGLICGAATSGLGYALWYRVLPQVSATTGAVAQLSVPVIALAAGAVLLNEAVTMQVVAVCAIVLGGIAVAVVKRG